MGFDGKTHIGELIVNQAIAQDVLEIMENDKSECVCSYGEDGEYMGEVY